MDTTRPNNRQCWLHLKLPGSLAVCTFLRSEDFLGTTYRFTLARPLVMEVRKTIINNTHGMSLVNFVNERVSFNACVCIEWISLVNGLPLQCRMTFLTPSHTHTHTHTHYSRASMMPSRLNPSSTMKEETNWQKSSSTLTIRAGSSRKVRVKYAKHLSTTSEVKEVRLTIIPGEHCCPSMSYYTL